MQISPKCNLFLFLFGLLPLLFSCGNDDVVLGYPPTASKTDMEIVSESITGSTWSLISITTVDNTFWAGANLCPPHSLYVAHVKFEFGENGFAKQYTCDVEVTGPSGKPYRVDELEGVFVVTVGSFKWELITPVSEMNGNKVVGIKSDNADGAKGSIWAFERTKKI